MSCYRLFSGYQLDSGTIVFGGPDAPAGRFIRLPCGQCFGCRMERSKMWAIRCQHEAAFWDNNAFVTLTYDDDHLPWHGWLVRKDLQLFLKRFRKAFEGVQCAPDSERRPVRYFACGEYGDTTKRPHFHLLLFNVAFSDKRVYGKDTFTSESLSKLWSYGSSLIGSVTPASAAYVAGYVSKKVRRRFYERPDYKLDPSGTGEYVERQSEFSAMSLKPAIGQYWYDRYKTDLHNGFLVHDGTKSPIPRFYEDKYRADFPDRVGERELLRARRAMERAPTGQSEDRLIAAELVAVARKRLFGRSPNFISEV